MFTTDDALARCLFLNKQKRTSPLVGDELVRPVLAVGEHTETSDPSVIIADTVVRGVVQQQTVGPFVTGRHRVERHALCIPK